MKVLLDTQALIWWLENNPKLGPTATELISDPATTVFVSVVSIWEIVIKSRIRKLNIPLAAVEDAISQDGFTSLAITPAHLAILRDLPFHHRDPFDHLLIAQAVSEQAHLMTSDRRAPLYPVKIVACSD